MFAFTSSNVIAAESSVNDSIIKNQKNFQIQTLDNSIEHQKIKYTVNAKTISNDYATDNISKQESENVFIEGTSYTYDYSYENNYRIIYIKPYLHGGANI